MIHDGLASLVGQTPMVHLRRFQKQLALSGRLLAKLEAFNPGGSVKDRIAQGMLEAAKMRGLLKPGAVIVEATSGNTGIGLAWLAATEGYELILTMPESMSMERRKLLKAYGATVILTEASKGMKGALEKARELLAEIPGSFMPSQFVNSANPQTHYQTTAEEIWEDAQGQIDCFVAGVGTGGTISGVGAFLKEKNPLIEIIAIEPAASPVLSGGKPGPHKIQGIGAGFVPEILNLQGIDQVIAVTEEEAQAAVRVLAKTEGILAGWSSGAALAGAVKSIEKRKKEGTVVILLPDTGERYLSTALFDEA